MAQLTEAAALEQNQKMIQEWKDECNNDGHLAFYMAVIDKKQQIHIFRSEGMDCQMLIRQLEFVTDRLKKNPF